jgi:sulfate transport system ATP-binding protein
MLRRCTRFHDSMGVTSVFVTHDQEEALELADRVVAWTMAGSSRSPRRLTIYDRPSNAFVYDFVSVSHRLPAIMTASQYYDRTLGLLLRAARTTQPADLPSAQGSRLTNGEGALEERAGDADLPRAGTLRVGPRSTDPVAPGRA